MTQPDPAAPPPPPPGPGPQRLRFDGTFVGPVLPPSPPVVVPVTPVVPAPPPVAEAVLSIPLGTRGLVSTALDLLTRTDSGLRSASFYIGFMLLLTVGPALALFVAVLLTAGGETFGPLFDPAYDPAVVELAEPPGAWAGWLSLAILPAALGYIAAGVDARILATAVIGGRAEGRPLRLRESIAIVRRRFWRVLGAEIVIGVVAYLATLLVSFGVILTIGPVAALDYGIQVLVGLVVGAPFVYVTAGIVLGEVGVVESIRRSFGLVRARKGLAVVVTLFGILSQLLVVLGLGAGLDAVLRVAIGAGVDETFPPALGVLVTAAFTFALGTLVFLVEAIAAAPAVYAFTALTHYTRGLELGRREPLPVRRPWQPYLTVGLAIGTVVALVALLGGIGSLPL